MIIINIESPARGISCLLVIIIICYVFVVFFGFINNISLCLFSPQTLPPALSTDLHPCRCAHAYQSLSLPFGQEILFVLGLHHPLQISISLYISQLWELLSSFFGVQLYSPL